MICLFCNFDPYVLSINAFLPGKTPLPVVWLSYPLDKLFATIYTILVSLAAASCVFRFTAYRKRDSSIYLFAAFRTKAHGRVCPPVIQVGAPITSHGIIASFSDNFGTPRKVQRSSRVIPFCRAGLPGAVFFMHTGVAGVILGRRENITSMWLAVGGSPYLYIFKY
jgi:hypothetical protein